LHPPHRASGPALPPPRRTGDLRRLRAVGVAGERRGPIARPSVRPGDGTRRRAAGDAVAGAPRGPLPVVPASACPPALRPHPPA
nr:hypothetical protein [Tanacetum cinerariifolium]